MRLIRSTLPFAFALCLTTTLAHAQAGPDVFFGVGTMTDDSSKMAIDTFGTGNPFTSPRLGGTFGKAGADIMITPYLGFGGEADFRLAQGAYAGLGYRPTFYDFNAIFAPTARRFKRVVPELQAGVGAVNLKFYSPSATFCDQFAGCSTSSTFL
jgi:hypothetical protein